MNIKNKTSFSKRLLLCACMLLGMSMNTQASGIEKLDRALESLDRAGQRLVNNLTEIANEPEEALISVTQWSLTRAAEEVENLADRIRPPSRAERFVRWINREFSRITQCFRR